MSGKESDPASGGEAKNRDMFTKRNDLKPFASKVWLSSPTMHGDELRYITEAYETNWMSTVGANINEVERIAAEKAGVQYAVGLSCGTAALHLCVKLAGERLYGRPAVGHGAVEGRRVFCSDMTFDATVNPVVYEGGIPVFIDTQRDSWNMDPAALEKAFAVYPDVKLVVCAELYGFSGDIRRIKEICEAHGALLIEDAAEALGAAWKGRPCGSFGDYAAVSYNGNKIITGSAGGCLLTNDLEAANKAKKWSTQARENVPWYQHEEVGYNYRMSNVIAGVIRGQYPHLEEHIAQKKAIYERYQEGLRGLPVSMNPIVQGCMPKILEALSGISAEGRPIWKPMHMQPIYRMNAFITRNGNGRAGTNAYIEGGIEDVGADVFERGLCLPSDNKMTMEQQDRIIEAIRACFE